MSQENLLFLKENFEIVINKNLSYLAVNWGELFFSQVDFEEIILFIH
jgi:hypothetical protein